MKPVKTAFPIEQLKNSMNKETLMLRIMGDLLKVHKEFIDKVEDLRENIQKQRGPEGPKPTQREILDIVRPVIDLTYGRDIRSAIKDLMPVVKDGETPTKEELLDLIKPLIYKLERRTETKLLTAVQMYEMIRPFLPKNDIKSELFDQKDILTDWVIERLKEEKKLKTADIYGLSETLASMWSQIGKSGNGKMRGGGDTIRQGTNIILTRNEDGTITISAMGGGSGSNVTSETITGIQSGDDVTLDFSNLANTPTSIIQIVRNTAVQTPGSTGVNGYTLTALTSATVYQADAGDTFLVTYSYA
jgi:hypothetical protein